MNRYAVWALIYDELVWNVYEISWSILKEDGKTDLLQDYQFRHRLINSHQNMMIG